MSFAKTCGRVFAGLGGFWIERELVMLKRSRNEKNLAATEGSEAFVGKVDSACYSAAPQTGGE